MSKTSKMHSNLMTKGVSRAPHRSLLRAIGLTEQEMGRPLVEVVNSHSEIIPGHMHLNSLAEAVKTGVLMGGGTPVQVQTIGVCDGLAMNHPGMKYSLASRELIADSVEVVARAHCFDAMVLIPNCDKIVPGMLMAAARLEIPAIVLSGGPMLAGRHGDRSVDLATVFEAVGAVKAGRMSTEELKRMEEAACPSCGSCAGMFTANSMNCLTESLGMALPGNGTIRAVMSARLRLAKQAGMQIMQLWRSGTVPRQIMTSAAFRNALVVDMALGCSTNTLLHLLAIAYEAGVTLQPNTVNEIAAGTPNLCRISPAGSHHMEDLDRAGGAPALMSQLSAAGLLDRDCLTVTGKTIAENAKGYGVLDHEVIRPLDNPYSKEGGLVVLSGNLAPNGAVVKRSAVSSSMLRHEGSARVFESEEEATAAILDNAIHAGEVVVIRYEGPQGGPGMREMLTPTSALAGMGLDSAVSLLTDGRFSGATRGAGVPSLLAVHKDSTGHARDVALAYAKGIGATRAAIIETTFAEETESDLFGEQAVLCGGMTALVKAGFDTLVEAGYQPEIAYFECLHEMKLIVDLMYEGGMKLMRYSISDTAEYGDLTRGAKVIGPEMRAAMKRILEDVRSGEFAREWILENRAGRPVLHARRNQEAAHLIERVGGELRQMMSWLPNRR